MAGRQPRRTKARWLCAFPSHRHLVAVTPSPNAAPVGFAAGLTYRLPEFNDTLFSTVASYTFLHPVNASKISSTGGYTEQLL